MTLMTLRGVDLDVPADQLAAYRKLLTMVTDIEARFCEQFAVDQVDPLEDALKAAGLTDVQIAVVRALQAPGAEEVVDGVEAEVPEVEVPEVEVPEVEVPTSEPRTCPNHRGAYHVPSKYGLLSDTPTTKRVMGFCSCGYQFQNLVKCPHQNQNLPGGRTGPVVCTWCASIVYGGTGAVGLDDAIAKERTSLPAVNPDAFNGNL
jgi:uncharacterized protein YbaA (DUF1428 family)